MVKRIHTLVRILETVTDLRTYFEGRVRKKNDESASDGGVGNDATSTLSDLGEPAPGN